MILDGSQDSSASTISDIKVSPLKSIVWLSGIFISDLAGVVSINSFLSNDRVIRVVPKSSNPSSFFTIVKVNVVEVGTEVSGDTIGSNSSSGIESIRLSTSGVLSQKLADLKSEVGASKSNEAADNTFQGLTDVVD